MSEAKKLGEARAEEALHVEAARVVRRLSDAQSRIVRSGSFSGDFSMATVRALKRKGLFYHHITSPNGQCGPMRLTALGRNVQALLADHQSTGANGEAAASLSRSLLLNPHGEKKLREDLAHADAQGHHALLMPIEDLRALLSALELGRHLAKDALPGGETHPAALTSSLPADVVYALDWIEHARKAIAPLHSQGEDYIWRPVRRAMSALDAASEQLQPALSASTTDSGKGRLDAEARLHVDAETVCEPADGWRPIESAPRADKGILIASTNFGVCEGKWSEADQMFRASSYNGTRPRLAATHWMPLPAPPTGEGGGL